MKVIKRMETASAFPNIAARGIVALVVTQRGNSLYQHGERADGSKTKAVRVPAGFSN